MVKGGNFLLCLLSVFPVQCLRLPCSGVIYSGVDDVLVVLWFLKEEDGIDIGGCCKGSKPLLEMPPNSTLL